MRKTIYVIDPVCPQSYDFEVLKKDGLGASESYLLFWINDLLGDNKIHLENTEIIFFQAHRKKTDSILYKENNNKLTFSGLESVLEYEHLDPQSIILQRDPRLYDYCKRIYPEANLILYCHDFFEGSPFQKCKKEELEKYFHATHGFKFVFVSEWQKNNYLENLKLLNVETEHIYMSVSVNTKMEVIYFYFPDNLKKLKKQHKKIERDLFKIGYFAGDHKGLNEALNIFSQLRKINDKFSLVVSSPKYNDYEIDDGNGVSFLKNIPREEVLKEMSSCLCLLHPNKVYPETFGCVNMEANYLGIPVICYRFGATGEWISELTESGLSQIIENHTNNYLFDPLDVRRAISKILAMHNNEEDRMALLPNSELINKETTLKQWLEILTTKY